MPYPISVKKNNYFEKRKNSTVLTPKLLADNIFDIVQSSNWYESENPVVYDIGCNSGELSLPFKDTAISCVGIDIADVKYHSTFIKCDFLTINKNNFPENNLSRLFLCNPPFNWECQGHGRKLLPELFLRKIFELFGTKVPVVLISPMGMMLNQRLKSKRWPWLRDCGCEITSRLVIPIDIFPEVAFHAEVLFFNIHGIKATYFLEGV